MFFTVYQCTFVSSRSAYFPTDVCVGEESCRPVGSRASDYASEQARDNRGETAAA